MSLSVVFLANNNAHVSDVNACVPSAGAVAPARSIFRLSIVTEIFWRIVNGFAFFFQTLFSVG